MRQYAYLSQFGHPYFKKSFVWSVGLHMAVLTLTILLPLIPWLKGKREAKYTTAVRVDIVELPSEVIHRVNQSLISTRDAILSLRKESTFQMKQAVREQKQKSAIEKLKEHETEEKKERQAKADTLRRGNIKSEGALVSTSPSGEVLDAYRSELYERVKLRWALPSYLRQQSKLTGELIIFLNPDGTILRTQIVSSGNREFDDFMNRALQESLPFPDVPKDLERVMRYDGISMIFHPGELK